MVTVSGAIELVNGDTAPPAPSGSTGVGGKLLYYIRSGQLYSKDAAGTETLLLGASTTRQIIAGAGLTGGGDLSADRTLNVANADGTLTVTADDVKVGALLLANHPDGQLTNAKLADMAQGLLKGRAAAAGTGAPADLTAAQAKTLLAIASGDVSGLTFFATLANLTGDVTTSGTSATTIANDAVTNAKLANMADSTVKGQIVGGSGDPVDLSATQLTAIENFGITSRSKVASFTLAAVATEQVPGVFQIPANALQAGDSIALHFAGSITGTATGGNVTARVRIGAAGTVAGLTAAIAASEVRILSAQAVRRRLTIDAVLTVRTITASGTIIGDINMSGGTINGTPTVADGAVIATVALNSTIANDVGITLQFSATTALTAASTMDVMTIRRA